MKTLKKTLCLVLAVVMVVGVLILPAYAKDSYTAATTALQNYGVLQGYPDGKLHEDANITRGQMAAIIYRIMTGDTSSTDAQVATKYGSYADRYTDADVAPWAKGYIGYCTNQGVLKGYDTGAIQPNKQINGYEVMAMLLRALGYDHNNEYTGNNWQYNVLSDAAKTGINKNVNDYSPDKATPRGAVAQYAYDAAVKTDRVAPTVYPNVGYSSISKKLIVDNGSETTRNDWGVPSTKYSFTFTYPDTKVEGTKSIEETPVNQAWAPITECDAGVDGEVTFYFNGKSNTKTDEIQETDTVSTIGAYGRWTRIYEDGSIVCIDTVLGNVKAAGTGTLQDTGSHDVGTAGKAKFDVYYNNQMFGATSNTVAFAAATATLSREYSETSTLAKNTVVTANILTASTPTKNSIGGSLKNIATATAEVVTINGITTDSTGITGFTGTNGKTYHYSITYSYNKNVDTFLGAGSTVLGTTAIGKTFSVYTDGHDNVIGIAQDASTSSYGLVVARKTVPTGTATAAGALEYELEYTILTKDNTQTTLKSKYVNSTKTESKYYVPGSTDANGLAQSTVAVVGQLVKITSNPIDSGYSILTPETTTGKTTATVKCGDPYAAHATSVVNAGTVIYVANYTMDNVKGGYVCTGYTAYTDFRSIPNIDVTTSNKVFGIDGEEITSHSNLGITVITDADSDADVDYVLITLGAQQSTVTATTVPNYVYIIGGSKVTYSDHYTYGVILNGTKTTMNVANDSAYAANLNGLHTYAETTNSTNRIVEANAINAVTGSWSYSDGLIKVGTVSGFENRIGTVASNNYISTSNDVKVYIVNTITGEVYNTTYTLDQLDGLYGTANIYVEFDQYNLVRALYIEDNMEETVGGKTKITEYIITADSDSVGGEGLPLSGVILDEDCIVTTPNDDGDPVATFTATWQRRAKDTGVTWVDCAADEVFNFAGYTYQLVFKVTAASKYEIDSNTRYTAHLNGYVKGLSFAAIAGGTAKTFTVSVTPTAG